LTNKTASLNGNREGQNIIAMLAKVMIPLQSVRKG